MRVINVSRCYENRFSDKERLWKYDMWKELCNIFLQRFVDKRDTVMDIGAGYCEFINNIKCARKIAVDVNSDIKKFANKNVEVFNKKIFNLPAKFNNNIDVVFLSNVLEHLDSKEDVLAVLSSANKFLKKNGKIILIQPNIDLVKEAYWDFIDHKVALNTKSIREALEITGFKLDVYIIKFLPYTTKNTRLPMMQLLLRIYFLIPEIIRPFAGQSFVVGHKINGK